MQIFILPYIVPRKVFLHLGVPVPLSCGFLLVVPELYLLWVHFDHVCRVTVTGGVVPEVLDHEV